MFKAASMKLGLDYAVMHNMKAEVSFAKNETSLAESTAESEGKNTKVSQKKSKVAKAKVIEGITMERAEHASALSKKELENLLKHGAYDIFRENQDGKGDEESIKFFETDIDQILQVKIYNPSISFAFPIFNLM